MPPRCVTAGQSAHQSWRRRHDDCGTGRSRHRPDQRLAAGLVAAESALQLGLTSRAELREVLEHCVDWPGARDASRVVSFASALSESAGESLARLAPSSSMVCPRHCSKWRSTTTPVSSPGSTSFGMRSTPLASSMAGSNTEAPILMCSTKRSCAKTGCATLALRSFGSGGPTPRRFRRRSAARRSTRLLAPPSAPHARRFASRGPSQTPIADPELVLRDKLNGPNLAVAGHGSRRPISRPSCAATPRGHLCRHVLGGADHVNVINPRPSRQGKMGA